MLVRDRPAQQIAGQSAVNLAIGPVVKKHFPPGQAGPRRTRDLNELARIGADEKKSLAPRIAM